MLKHKKNILKIAALSSVLFLTACGGNSPDQKEHKKNNIQEVQHKAEAEAQRKAEAEAQRKAEAEAQRKAEAEAQRKAEAEAQRKAEAEAQRKAEAEAQRKSQLAEQLANKPLLDGVYYLSSLDNRNKNKEQQKDYILKTVNSNNGMKFLGETGFLVKYTIIDNNEKVNRYFYIDGSVQNVYYFHPNINALERYPLETEEITTASTDLSELALGYDKWTHFQVVNGEDPYLIVNNNKYQYIDSVKEEIYDTFSSAFLFGAHNTTATYNVFKNEPQEVVDRKNLILLKNPSSFQIIYKESEVFQKPSGIFRVLSENFTYNNKKCQLEGEFDFPKNGLIKNRSEIKIICNGEGIYNNNNNSITGTYQGVSFMTKKNIYFLLNGNWNNKNIVISLNNLSSVGSTK